MIKNPERSWFGTKQVSPEEKTRLVESVFSSVARRYDLMNDLMSAGIHRLWKDRLVREIAPQKGLDYLDVAGGTGDIAFRIYDRLGDEAPIMANIMVCDLTQEMLDEGRARAIDTGRIKGLSWKQGNAEKLPFADDSFDVYTISFGLRNVTHIDNALNEAFRVLRPGGRFFCLEFSKVTDPVLSKCYDIYSDRVIPKMGKIVASDSESYAYLVESIRKFPNQEDLAKRVREAGFSPVTYTNLSLGIACIHEGWKI